MTQSLWPQLRLKADTEDELIEAYRDVYLKTYVFDEQGQRRVFTDWTGVQVIFAKGAFDHAFSKAKNKYHGTGVHDGGFDHSRARRILWISEVLAASAGTIERYSQLAENSRGEKKKRRVYVVVDEQYVVVLEEPRKKSGPHMFITAYPSNKTSIDQRIRQRAGKVETKKR